MIELPNLESLRCFVLAATHTNFRTAARKAALSPAAFGARIRRLEGATRPASVPAHDAPGRADGARRGGYPQAKSCIEQAVRCAAPLERDEPVPFDLVLGSRFDVGLRWVVPAFGALERTRPERRLHAAFGNVDQLMPRIFRDEVQCVLTTARLGNPNLISTPFRGISSTCSSAKPALLEKNPLVRPEDAARHVLLDFDADLPLFRFFRDARPPKETWTFQRQQYLSIVAAVRARVLEGGPRRRPPRIPRRRRHQEAPPAGPHGRYEAENEPLARRVAPRSPVRGRNAGASPASLPARAAAP